jgi:hypothetical protein
MILGRRPSWELPETKLAAHPHKHNVSDLLRGNRRQPAPSRKLGMPEMVVMKKLVHMLYKET